MIFFDCSTAPNPRRARMVLAEKGVAVETREISIATGAQLEAGYRAINPQAMVPALQLEDGSLLTENLGIAAYLEALVPEPPLLGRDAREKGLVMMWTAIVEQQGGLPIAEALRNAHPAFENRAIPGPVDYAQIPALADRGQRRAVAFLDLLETRLAQGPYLAGAHFSFADITAFVFVDFARVIKLRVPETHVATRDWQARIAARPSAAV
ncbi:glutathione S-transferase family protein [Tritonibacter horizontis]|uniref:Glutathione S-transferase GST-6.0 n=1 Tax=Tritonibacter horizontis TaxID=1768241 RepID=A0A132C4F0_9RHOB|nr:glutathione S-transferase [Tritonibacter horizontis]KUP95062.1 glutathione S-transferase GST-6.0 [Tritonibacter horizontis]